MELLQAAYESCSARADAYEARHAAILEGASIPPLPFTVTNEERSALELYRFIANPPESYFLYINEKARGELSDRPHAVRDSHFAPNGATTWTGTPLGNVRFGQEYRGGFGDKRVPVTVYGVNGVLYHGTYYKSAGSYARIKRAKNQPKQKGE